MTYILKNFHRAIEFTYPVQYNLYIEEESPAGSGIFLIFLCVFFWWILNGFN